MTSSRASFDDDAVLLNRVLGHLRWTLESLSDDMGTIGPGWIVRTRSLSRVWTLNQLRLTETATFAEVVALAEEHQGDLAYRHAVLEDGTAADGLEAPFGAAGWHSDCEVLMALAGRSDREVDTSAVVELTEEQMLVLMRRWITEEHPGIEAALDELDEYNRREGKLWNERCFGLLDRHGAPAAITKLRSRGNTAWVEDVYTVPEQRGHGSARSLVTHAVEVARSADHDLTFIIADDNDWPKHLYKEIGFRPIGTTRTFHRDLAPTS